jgi:hypothetical protein
VVISSWLFRFLSNYFDKANVDLFTLVRSWSMSVLALFEPIAPLQADQRAKGPVRKKWDGASPAPDALRHTVQILVTLAVVTGLVVSLFMISKT